MTIRTLPAAPQGRPQAAVRGDIVPRALDRWNGTIRAAAEEERSISIFDVIGVDYWTGEGVTAKRIAGALRTLGKGPVTVHVNSPGGDMFEGLAIYNLLREHPGEVTVKVLGLAASAASVIAMAGDTIQIARAGFLMVHNAWVMAVGNRHDLRDYADTLEPFDRAMADIYAARAGIELKAAQKLMDAETWIGGADAIEQGFADELLPSDQVEKGEDKTSAASVRRVEAALRAAGMPAAEAKRVISELKAGARDAAGAGERDATEDDERDAVEQETATALAEALRSVSFSQ
jgi:ATP-dependent Clp protease protease subunit